jgi:hypothetical protein
VVLQMPACDLAKDNFGPMGQAVHEDQIAQGDQKVTRSPLPQLERPFIRGDAVDDFPGLGHGQNLDRYSIRLYTNDDALQGVHCVIFRLQNKKKPQR